MISKLSRKERLSKLAVPTTAISSADNYNRHLKNIFKGAATTVITQQLEPMVDDYQRALAQGTKPPMAKLTLARRISATVLAMWKNKEAYHPERYRPTP
jgi:hypothetical protein